MEKTSFEEMQTYAHELTKAITGIAGGGSELFDKQLGDIYTADIPYCVNKINDRISRLHNMVVEKTHRIHELEKAGVSAVEPLEAIFLVGLDRLGLVVDLQDGIKCGIEAVRSALDMRFEEAKP